MLHNIVYVEYVWGFYFARAQGDNSSADILRQVIGSSAFSGGELSRVRERLVAEGYALVDD